MDFEKYGDRSMKGLFILFIAPIFAIMVVVMFPLFILGWIGDNIEIMINKYKQKNR